MSDTENHTGDALRRASFSGDTRAVGRLLSAGVSPDVAGDDGRTALMEAAGMGQVDVLKLLIDAGADVAGTDNEGASALLHAARNAREAVALVLLDSGADPNAADKYGRTALMAAAGIPVPGLVALLLDRGSEVNRSDVGGETALSAAIGCGNPKGRKETVSLLLEHNADVRCADRYGRTPLHRAAGLGEVPVILALLDRGAEIDPRDHEGMTPLMSAFSIGYPGAARALLARGASKLAEDASGRTVLHYASNTYQDRCAGLVPVVMQTYADLNPCDRSMTPPVLTAASRGNEESLRLLLDGGAAAQWTNSYGETPLGAAAKAGCSACVRQLLKHGGRTDTLFQNRTTVLHLAVGGAQDAVGCVKALLESGADPGAKDDRGMTPSDIAQDLGRPEIVTLLSEAVNRRSDPDRLSVVVAQLHEAVARNDVNRVRAVLSGKERPGEAELAKAFIRASDRGHHEIARAILRGGLDPDAKGPRGWPLVMELVLERRINPEAVLALIEAGVAPNVETENRTSLLVWLCGLSDESFYEDRPVTFGQSDHEKLERAVEELIRRGADPNAMNDDRETPLLWAAKKRRKEMVEILLKHAAEPNVAGPLGSTPLMVSARRGDTNIEMTRILLEAGADPTVSDEQGLTALAHAAAAGGTATVELLRQAEQEFAGGSRPDNKAALVQAAGAGSTDLVRRLLSLGTHVDGATEAGGPAIVLAAHYGHLDVVALLLEHGARTDLTDRDDQTPLTAACRMGRTAVVKLLLEADADPNLPGMYGLNPLMFAADLCNPEIIRALLERGADPNPSRERFDSALMRCAMTAANKHDPKTVESSMGLLASYGADPDLRNWRGDTALLIAVGIEQYRVMGTEKETPSRVAAVKALLKAGADSDSMSEDGLKAEDVATGMGFDRIVRILDALHYG